MNYCQSVKEFTANVVDVPETPQLMSEDRVRFISRMVNDELEELAEATTIQDQADALVDAIYYICDSAIRHGVDLDPLFSIVHEANMRKFVDGKPIKNEDGKVLKPEGWYGPDEDFLKELQRQQGLTP